MKTIFLDFFYGLFSNKYTLIHSVIVFRDCNPMRNSWDSIKKFIGDCPRSFTMNYFRKSSKNCFWNVFIFFLEIRLMMPSEIFLAIYSQIIPRDSFKNPSKIRLEVFSEGFQKSYHKILQNYFMHFFLNLFRIHYKKNLLSLL